MYLYLFTSTAWKFFCTVCSTVDWFTVLSRLLKVFLDNFQFKAQTFPRLAQTGSKFSQTGSQFS